MEIALPVVALSGLYLINNQSKKQASINKFEAFTLTEPNSPKLTQDLNDMK